MKLAELNYNERSWAIDLISYINKIIDEDSSIKRAGGEFSLRGDGQTLFPDVILFGDKGTGNILQGWELKMPDTPIGDSELFTNAKEKATRLGLNSFLLWNAVDVRLYIFNGSSFELCDSFCIDKLPYISRQDVHDRPDLWQDATTKIISKLNIFFKTGKLQTISANVVFSDKGLIPLILSSQSDVKQYLLNTIKKNIHIDSAINSWWKCVHNEYPGYDAPYGPLAYTIILRWFNRFVFSNILYAYGKIKCSKPILPANASIDEAIILFKKISTQTDYWNIIGPTDFDNLLPDSVWKKLLAVFNLLQDYDFSQIDKSILSEIVHSTVLLSIKKAAGLFSTPQNLAELLVRLSLWDKDAPSIDPFCGTGTIVKNILEVKGEYNIDGKTIVRNTWACDKFGFPVQVATLSVASPEIINESLQIFTHDALKLKVGEEVDFINPVNGSKINRKIPQFGSIISNLPFVAFEDISELNPEVFTIISDFYRSNSIESKAQLGGRSDLYFFIPFILIPLLQDNGILGIIISNSWLSTDAGDKFWNLLRKTYNVLYVITSAKGRWFQNTDVVANILILQKNAQNEDTRFVSLNVDINEVEDVKDIADDIINDNISSKHITMQSYTEKELQNIQKLGFGVNSCFANCRWLINNISKFEHISAYATVGRGARRGWDPLFYPSGNDSKEIEPEYIKKVFKTARGNVCYDVTPTEDAFCCEKSVDELKDLGHTGALSWIEKFEHATNEKGKPLTYVLRHTNMQWYEMSASTLATLALSVDPGEKICIYRFNKPTFVNQRLISISLFDGVDIDLLHALLNSIFCTSQIESLGFGRGLGVLDINSKNIRNNLYVPRLALFNKKDRDEIVEIFSKIKKREILNTIDTINNKEWINFNVKIAKSLNLSEEFFKSACNQFKTLYLIRKSVGR